MYSASELSKYDFFKNILKKNKLEYITDPLTGLIARKYMLEFVESLINEKKAFSLAILDLDDFKLINDQYGHATGDLVLESVASDLIKYIGSSGLAGRYGGDEFIIVSFGFDDYDSIHNFYDGIYHKETVLRKHFINNDIDIFITGTMGSASYPINAQSFEELFLMADKTLYRGKTKGRNCYIVYVHEKHKDLQIKKMHNDDLPTMMSMVDSIFSEEGDTNEKISSVGNYLKENLTLDKLFYIDINKTLYDLDKLEILSPMCDISAIKFYNNLYKTDYRGEVSRLPGSKYIEKFDLASILMCKIEYNHKIFGYIAFALKRTAKIWDNNEIAILLYFAKIIALDITSK